jgi:glycolate oxidase iron-sulfur subunit
MLALAPREVPRAVTLPDVCPRAARGARVALLAGCAQQVLEAGHQRGNDRRADAQWRGGAGAARAGVLWRAGVAYGRLARRAGVRAIGTDAFPAGVDAIITNAAGCGLRCTSIILSCAAPRTSRGAESFRKRVVDVSVFLARLGWSEKPAGWSTPQAIAYHDACHLANAQNVRTEPRSLLRAIRRRIARDGQSHTLWRQRAL